MDLWIGSLFVFLACVGFGDLSIEYLLERFIARTYFSN
jgi:hypothetical protein